MEYRCSRTVWLRGVGCADVECRSRGKDIGVTRRGGPLERCWTEFTCEYQTLPSLRVEDHKKPDSQVGNGKNPNVTRDAGDGHLVHLVTLNRVISSGRTSTRCHSPPKWPPPARGNQSFHHPL